MKYLNKTILLTIVVFGFLSMALTVEYISLERMTLESHVIVYGKVKNSYSVWEGKNIYTYSAVDIIQDVKGNLANRQRITIKQLGGTVGDIGQEVSGTPRLKKDSEVILFLSDWKNNLWIHSIAMGYYEVIADDGNKLAVNNFNKVYLIDPVTKKPIENLDKIRTSYELNDLISEVKQILSKESNNE